MKSRGIFPSRGGVAKGYRNRSAAGNSTGKGGPPFGRNGYQEGALGDRASPMGGGAKMDAMVANRPAANDTALDGHGGCAWDKSMAGYDLGGYSRLEKKVPHR